MSALAMILALILSILVCAILWLSAFFQKIQKLKIFLIVISVCASFVVFLTFLVDFYSFRSQLVAGRRFDFSPDSDGSTYFILGCLLILIMSLLILLIVRVRLTLLQRRQRI